MKMNKEVVMVRLSDIIPNRFQPRLTFDEQALNELANSIKEHGVIQPLILRDLGSKYEIIAGERRYKASTLAGLTEVPAIIGAMDDQTSAELALIENIQRKDLSAIEEAKSYKKILDMGHFTQEELAKRMGKSQSTVANKMRLLMLTNEVQVALMNNLISERHARCLLQIKDDNLQKEVLNKIINERMNVRDTDDYIKNILGISKEEIIEERKEVEINIPKIVDEKKVNLPNNNEIKEQTNNIPVELINTEAPKETPIEMKANNNPNVYLESTSGDFINILNLEDPIVENPVKEALNDLDVIKKESEIFNGNSISVEEKEVSNMPDVVIPLENKEEDDISKVKVATAIRIAKDSVEEIRKAGYKVNVEEINKQEEYQIIIKVEK